MIVEFIGLPASGKSTLAKKIYGLKELESRLICYPLHELYKRNWLERNLIKTFKVFLFSISKPLIVWRILNVIYLTKQRSLYDYFKTSLNLVFITSVLNESKNKDEIILIDEGLLHHMWAVLYSSTNKGGVIKISKFNLIEYFPDIVVNVECDSEIIIKRILERRSNTRIEKEEDIFNAVKRSINVKYRLVEGVKEYLYSNNSKLITIENQNLEEIESNINCIIETIKDQL